MYALISGFVFVGYLFSFRVSASSVSMPNSVVYSQVIPADVECCDSERSWCRKVGGEDLCDPLIMVRDERDTTAGVLLKNQG